MAEGFKPMSFGQHLLRALTLEESGMSKDEVRTLLESEPTEFEGVNAFVGAQFEGEVWIERSNLWSAEYLFDCINERYANDVLVNVVETLALRFEEALESPVLFAFRLPFPLRLTLLATTAIKNLSPGSSARAAVALARERFATIDQSYDVSITPAHLRSVFAMDELAGVSRDNIPVYLDPHGWDLADPENFETPRVSNFDRACGEAEAWVVMMSSRSEYDLLNEVDSFDRDLRLAASEAISEIAPTHENPLRFALRQPYPIRLTLLILAILRRFGSGGEAVNIASGLPPKPPSPGHWGGRTPGFEQPIPLPNENLDIGPRR